MSLFVHDLLPQLHGERHELLWMALTILTWVFLKTISIWNCIKAVFVPGWIFFWGCACHAMPSFTPCKFWHSHMLPGEIHPSHSVATTVLHQLIAYQNWASWLPNTLDGLTRQIGDMFFQTPFGAMTFWLVFWKQFCKSTKHHLASLTSLFLMCLLFSPISISVLGWRSQLGHLSEGGRLSQSYE